MGQFVEAEAEDKLSQQPTPRVFTQVFFDRVIQQSIDSGEIDKDAKLVFIAATDEKGVKAIVAASLINGERLKVKLNGVFEHDWGGDNKAGGKVIASFK